MRDLLSRSSSFLVWVAFFATSVYGHAALKFAVDDHHSPLAAALSFRGISAFVAWTFSGILWMLVLEKNTLLAASTLSAFRYVLITLVAWIFLRDPFDLRTLTGVGLVTAGVYLVAK